MYLGTWNASTNVPTLVASTGTEGDTYVVGVAGNTSLDGIGNWDTQDKIVFTGGVWTKTGRREAQTDLSQTLVAGAIAAAVALRLGATATEGLEIKVIDEVVTTTNAVENNLTNTIPSGAVILSVQANLQTLIVGDATGDDLGVKVGIGTTASPVKYGSTSALTKNLKVDTIPDWAVLGSAEQICVKLAKTGGTAATEKFVAGGQVRVRVVYATTNSLDNA